MVRGRAMKMRRKRRSKFSVRLSKEEVLNTWELSLQSIPLVQTCAIYTLYTDKVTLYTTVPVIVFVFVYLCICVKHMGGESAIHPNGANILVPVIEGGERAERK